MLANVIDVHVNEHSREANLEGRPKCPLLTVGERGARNIIEGIVISQLCRNGETSESEVQMQVCD